MSDEEIKAYICEREYLLWMSRYNSDMLIQYMCDCRYKISHVNQDKLHHDISELIINNAQEFVQTAFDTENEAMYNKYKNNHKLLLSIHSPDEYNPAQLGGYDISPDSVIKYDDFWIFLHTTLKR